MSMRRRTLVSLIVATILVLSILIVAVWPMLFPKVEIRLVNTAPVPVEAIRMDYRGGPALVSTLPAQSSTTLKIVPAGDSGLDVSYDFGGISHSQNVDVYMYNGQGGLLTLTWTPSGQVQWKDDTAPCKW